jgi:hypothetical protein
VSRGLDAENTRVAEAMTAKVVAVPENTEVERATELMEQRRVRRLLVTDEQRESLTGVVSLDRLSLYVGRYGMAMDERFEGEASADTREFPARFEPAALADEQEAATAIGSDPSVTTEAEVVERDARDQSDPRKGPRSLIEGEQT